MRNYLKRLIFVAVTSMLAILALGSRSASAPTYVSVKFTLASPITLNEPVAMDILITNQFSQGITFSPGVNFNTRVHFVIDAPDGKQVDLRPGLPRMGLVGGEFIYLEPKQMYSQRLVLNEWYPFDLVGTYRLSANYELPIKVGKTKAAFTPGFVVNEGLNADDHQAGGELLDLTVLPRNEAVLREKCHALLLKVQENRKSNPVAFSYAKELSYINDSVAIPYLIELSKLMEEQAAIDGLMLIGTDEAMEGMIEVTRSKYDESSASYARELLRERLPKIQDPIIRKKVEDAVKQDQ